MMRNTIAALTLAVFSMGASGLAEASDSFKKQSLSRTVMSGVRTKLGQHWHINNDCSLADVPVVRIVEPPKHGRLEIVRESVFPTSSGKLERCRTVKVMGLVAYYTAKAGYVGEDKFVLRSPYGDGKIADTTMNVTVLK
jgi:hypothetical protein